MSYAAKILTDSISPGGHRLTTFEVTLPRIVLAEINTHRTMSRNSASSRAIPVEKMLKRVEDDPFIPIYWGKNQKGMQAAEELSPQAQQLARTLWLAQRDDAAATVRRLQLPDLDLHKQIANRLLEPFLWHTVIATATEWGNFFNLRDNVKAQPEIQRAASMMHMLFDASSPSCVNYDEWHLPLVAPDEAFDIEVMDGDPVAAAIISAGRCARVSYLTHDGKRDPQADVALHDALLAGGHMSPLEHPARPMTHEELMMFRAPELVWTGRNWRATSKFTHFCGNYNGWIQRRKMIPGEADIHSHRGSVA